MGNSLKVSIIVPNYNYSEYLEKRFASIFSQTYDNYEIIVLDDCSTDDSRTVIEKYRSKFKMVVYNDSNSGSAFRQWKKGLMLASGDLVWIAESDDYCDSDMLEKLVSAFENDPVCTISFCRSALFKNGGDVFFSHENQMNFNNDFIMDGKSFSRDLLSLHNVIVNASSAVFRRDAALRVNDELMNFRGQGDMLFWMDIALQGTVHYCNSPMNKFRQHLDSQTFSLKDTYTCFDEALRFRYIIYKERKVINRRKYFFRRSYLLSSVMRAPRLTDQEKKNLFKMSGAGIFTKLYLLFVHKIYV